MTPDKALELQKLDEIIASLGLTQEQLVSSPELQESVASLLAMIDAGAVMPDASEQSELLEIAQSRAKNRAKRLRRKYR